MLRKIKKLELIYDEIYSWEFEKPFKNINVFSEDNYIDKCYKNKKNIIFINQKRRNKAFIIKETTSDNEEIITWLANILWRHFLDIYNEYDYLIKRIEYEYNYPTLLKRDMPNLDLWEDYWEFIRIYKNNLKPLALKLYKGTKRGFISKLDLKSKLNRWEWLLIISNYIIQELINSSQDLINWYDEILASFANNKADNIYNIFMNENVLRKIDNIQESLDFMAMYFLLNCSKRTLQWEFEMFIQDKYKNFHLNPWWMLNIVKILHYSKTRQNSSL